MKTIKLFALLAMTGAMISLSSCKNESNPAGSDQPLYPVSVTILNPQGQAQGGATVSVKGASSAASKGAYGVAADSTTAVTDSLGKATIKVPAGNQTLVAKIGSVFSVEFPVTVTASNVGTVVPAQTLVQNTAFKVLVVKASAENLEDVLRKVGFAVFDSIEVDALRDSVAADSNRTLTYFQQYTLVFSNCDGGSEDSYPLLARTIGRYVSGGGKVYGGHYNYMNLQFIYAPFYQQEDAQSPAIDSLRVVDNALKTFLGFDVIRWQSSDSRALAGYEKFKDLPSTTKVYGVLSGSSPQIAVIAENYTGSGKYLWTNYHNQDIINYPELVKIVNYFLYSL